MTLQRKQCGFDMIFMGLWNVSWVVQVDFISRRMIMKSVYTLKKIPKFSPVLIFDSPYPVGKVFLFEDIEYLDW